MEPIRDFDAISSDLAIWHAYDPAVKADLYSTGLITTGGIYLIDPILMGAATLDELISCTPVAGVVVTNSNHHRAAEQFAQQFSVPVFAHPETFPNRRIDQLIVVTEGDEICTGVRVIEIEGAAPGEIVIDYAGSGGTLIIGDALINFEPYGFAFLPARYCSDPKQMRRSLRKLLDFKAERILFAHGTPILAGAGDRLRALLDTFL